jgi:N-hydroxyarylamine O-acetyltransferase
VDHRTVEYLKRIGAERPTAPTPEALRDLHARHQLAVPFENLSIHLGEPIVLDEDSLFDKIVLRRRAASATSSTEPSAACSRRSGSRSRTSRRASSERAER